MRNKLLIPSFILSSGVIFAGTFLASSFTSAATTGSKPISVTVNAACTFASDVSYTANLSVAAGNYVTTESDTRTPASITCSGATSFAVHAIGFSPDSTSAGAGVEGNTAMYGSAGTIATGNSGDNSYWAMKVGSATSTTTYTISNGYGSYSAVPGSYTEIITYTGNGSDSVTGTFRPDYKISASLSQPVGTYTGKVKYLVATEV